MQKALLLVVGLLLGGAGTWWWTHRAPATDADPEAVARGKVTFQICSACHGPTGAGNPDTGAPRLAGQHPWYLERQLKNFRAGARGVDSTDVYGMMMRPQAEGLADDQAIADVVAYISTLR